jgi:hypothetical protein
LNSMRSINVVMFPYDAQLVTAAQSAPQTISGVLNVMRSIDAVCADGDGLKWFNWLYLQVTQAVENRVSAGGFNDPAWLAALDVQFAGLYFSALQNALTGAPCPGSWGALFAVRDQARTARIQFALAGMNAHINHDLPMAIIATCRAGGNTPQHFTPQYNDYTTLNNTLGTLIDTAKQVLHVRLLGDPLPPVSHLEDTLAAWDLSTARESAWNTAQNLWQEPHAVAAVHLDVIDGLTTVIGKTLLVPVP